MKTSAYALISHHSMALTYKTAIVEAAKEHNLARSLIVAIGSRESGWGMLLKPFGALGTGDGGHGRGLMQIDDRTWKEFIESGDWQDPDRNINFGCRILADNRRYFQKKLAETPELIERAAIAAYNCGPGNVMKAIRAGKDVDHFTAHGDYSFDVLERAKFFRRQGWV